MLTSLCQHFRLYFSEVNTDAWDWVRDPFAPGSPNSLTGEAEEQLLEISCDRTLSDSYRHHSKLIELIRRKGGVNREKTQRLLQALDRSLDANIKRECLLKCLTIYLGEDLDQLFKEYLVVQWEEAEMELSRASMAVFVIREEDDSLQPHEIGVVIDGVKVLNMLPSVAHACAMLFGLMYVLNLSYPGELKHMFEALQKLFMEIDPKKMMRKVLSLSVKL
uniref:Uncharacterized protein n=1 Tax=Knipowitschia caucasica TaxID=637954 RepID=A0AAV2KC71_KNICA